MRLNASAWVGRTCSCKPCVAPQGLAHATALEPSHQRCCSVVEGPGQQLERVRCGRRSREVEGEQHGARKLIRSDDNGVQSSRLRCWLLMLSRARTLVASLTE